MHRREFLKSYMAATLAASMGLPSLARAAASPNDILRRGIVLLDGGLPMGEAFAAGARLTADALGAPLSVVRLAPVADADILAALLERHRGQRLVALMDEASHTALEELAVSFGARVLVSGQHAWDGPASRHDLLALARAGGVGSALSGATGCAVAETVLGESNLGPANPALVSRDWAGAAGELYARVALDAWQPAVPAAPTAGGSPRPLPYSAASFVIEA